MPRTSAAQTQDVEPAKAEVFISYIALEQGLAEAIKTCIETAFEGGVAAHAGTGAAAGDLSGWAERLERRLFKSSVLLVIASRLSVKSPWVFFETGFATARAIKVIPICLPGQAPQSLPVPLVTGDALKLTMTQDFGKQLIGALKGTLGVSLKRGYKYGKLISDLRRGLDDLRLKFRLLVAIRDRPRAACTAKRLAPALKSSASKVGRALSELDQADYVSSGGLGYLPDDGYSLTERGKELLRRAGEDDRPQTSGKEVQREGDPLPTAGEPAPAVRGETTVEK